MQESAEDFAASLNRNSDQALEQVAGAKGLDDYPMAAGSIQLPENFEEGQKNPAVDTFYEEDFQPAELEEHDLDHILETDPEYFTEEYREEEAQEDFRMSEDEEQLLAELLKKKEKEDLVMKTYKSLEQRPSEEQIEEWKKRFGDVYLVSLSEHENFLFRPLKRLEWNQLTAQILKLPEAKKTEAILMRAVIFPKLTQNNVQVLTAGAPDTIRNLILEASNFIEPDRAVRLVRKL